MKRLTFTRKPVRPAKLIEELTAALDLAPWADEQGNLQTPVAIDVTQTEVHIWIIDEADEGAVADIYGSHDASTPGPLEQEEMNRLANEATLRQQADQALALLQEIIDRPAAEFTGAVLVGAVKDLARVEKGVIRLLIGRLESTD
jgi:hypothetical protein